MSDLFPKKNVFIHLLVRFFPTTADTALQMGYGKSRYRQLWVLMLNETREGQQQLALKRAMYAKFCTLRWAPSPDNQKWYAQGIRIVQNQNIVSLLEAGYRRLDDVLAEEAAEAVRRRMQ